MEELTGLEWNSGHLFEGIIGTIFFSWIQLECKHCTSGDLEYFSIQQSLTLFARSFFISMLRSPWPSPSFSTWAAGWSDHRSLTALSFVSSVWKWASCSLHPRALVWQPVRGPSPIPKWAETLNDLALLQLSCVFTSVHFTAASFLLTTCPSEFQDSHVLWLSVLACK